VLAFHWLGDQSSRTAGHSRYRHSGEEIDHAILLRSTPFGVGSAPYVGRTMVQQGTSKMGIVSSVNGGITYSGIIGINFIP
jgi:hypothetical protein